MKKVIITVAAAIAGALLLANVAAAAPAAAHTVRPGDTFWKLSQQYGTSVGKLMQANNKTTTMLYVGEQLTIPGGGATYTVHAGDSFWKLAQQYHTTVSRLMQDNGKSSDLLYVGELLSVPGPAEVAPAPTPAPAPKPQAQAPATKPTEGPSYGLNQFEAEVVTLTNVERSKAGLKPFQVEANLSGSARAKSQDMADLGYFSHTSPTYGSPFDMMKARGITYRTAAENIAKGQRTPQEVVTAWMNSSGHRANILNGNLTHIGVGYVDSVWTQQFIG